MGQSTERISSARSVGSHSRGTSRVACVSPFAAGPRGRTSPSRRGPLTKAHATLLSSWAGCHCTRAKVCGLGHRERRPEQSSSSSTRPRVRASRTYSAQGRLPREVSHSAWLPSRQLARRALGRGADGSSTRRLVRRLLLGFDGVSVCTRCDECRLDGARRRSHRFREADPVASLRDGGPTPRLRWARAGGSGCHTCADDSWIRIDVADERMSP